MRLTNFGPSGRTVYERTYSRTRPDGSKEDWPDTVQRVVTGNSDLIAKPIGWDRMQEEMALMDLMEDFAVIPAGRHLWASGVAGRQYLFNCWVAGWTENVADHFTFTFMRLMEGGGVGANYSSKNTERYGPPRKHVQVHIVCDPDHADYDRMLSDGLISTEYSPDYQGAYLEVEDSREGWSEALRDLLTAFWTEDGSDVRVYDVSRVRAAGSRLKTFGGSASGPGPLARMLHGVANVVNALGPDPTVDYWDGLPLDPISAMEIDHEIAMCVVAGGVRRSARMSIIPWDDPYIHEFICCKADGTKHWTTNISVGVDASFFSIVKKMDAWETRQVLDESIAGMLANGEPGFANLENANHGEVGVVECSNPCGEIYLESFEACNLGHINLEKFVNDYGQFELYDAEEAVRLMTRFLIRATFGDIEDPMSRAIMDRNRRIGVGLLGVQAAFAKMGIKYSDIPENDHAMEIMSYLRSAARNEARKYAFQLRIPEPVKITTIAPTGTIAKLPGTTEGIHPIYSRYFLRRIRFSTLRPEEVEQLREFEEQGYEIEDDIYAANTKVVVIPTKERLVQELEDRGIDPDILQSADELSISQMLKVQEFFQLWWADNAVSFTANVPEGKYDVASMREFILKYLPHLKGTTIMPDGTREQAPYERISKEDYELYKYTMVADSVDEECATGACPVR